MAISTSLIARLVLPVVLIVPTAVLFGQQRQSTGDDSAFAAANRPAVPNLQTPLPRRFGLTTAQSVAAAGGSVPREPLVAALGGAAARDGEFGAELGAHDRWTDVRTKIEAVPPTGAPAALFADYGEAVDLLLDLIDKVRDASGL